MYKILAQKIKYACIILVFVVKDFDYQQARKYWKVLKGRLIKEGNETVTKCYQLKLPAAACVLRCLPSGASISTGGQIVPHLDLRSGSRRNIFLM